MALSAVAAHYNANLQQEWERLERHRTEYAVTMKALQSYLPLPPARIADVGGGPGRYAIVLAQNSYQVTLVDIAEDAPAMAAAKAADAGVTLDATLCADALALPAEWDDRFDAVLLLGPLYHLLESSERAKAVCEAHRVIAPGGLIFASFINRFAPLRDLAINSPAWIAEHPARLCRLLQTGQNPAYDGSAFPDSYFARPEEIRPLMEACGFQTLNLIGCEGIVAGHEGRVNELSGELWDKWVALNYELGQEPSLYGAADHLLYVGRKQLAHDERPVRLAD
jgi:ubiquinone/menaquinone biosynthesis C-methylase UbiE